MTSDYVSRRPLMGYIREFKGHCHILDCKNHYLINYDYIKMPIITFLNCFSKKKSIGKRSNADV